MFINIWLLLFISIVRIDAEWRAKNKRVTAEYGSDFSLSCTFQSSDDDEPIVQWLYQNLTDNIYQRHKTYWKPLFLNTQSLTPKETRYSIQQKVKHINRTTLSYTTILTLSKITHSDEGLYMCKSLSPKTMEVTYRAQVIQSLNITPTDLLIPSQRGHYSILLNCILNDNHTDQREHNVFWWHNNRRLGSRTNRYARITKNLTENYFISTLIYTGKPENVAGVYICESEPLKKYITVRLGRNSSTKFSFCSHHLIVIFLILFKFNI